MAAASYAYIGSPFESERFALICLLRFLSSRGRHILLFFTTKCILHWSCSPHMDSVRFWVCRYVVSAELTNKPLNVIAFHIPFYWSGFPFRSYRLLRRQKSHKAVYRSSIAHLFHKKRSKRPLFVFCSKSQISINILATPFRNPPKFIHFDPSQSDFSGLLPTRINYRIWPWEDNGHNETAKHSWNEPIPPLLPSPSSHKSSRASSIMGHIDQYYTIIRNDPSVEPNE